MKFIETLASRNGNRIDLEPAIRLVEPVCKRYAIELLYLFGSYAHNAANKFSDLDVAFLAKKDLSENETNDFSVELQKIFEEEAIDLVNLEKSPSVLAHQVLKNGVCLFAGSLTARIEFETKSEQRYFDTEPLRRECFQAMERRLMNGSFGHR